MSLTFRVTVGTIIFLLGLVWIGTRYLLMTLRTKGLNPGIPASKGNYESPQRRRSAENRSARAARAQETFLGKYIWVAFVLMLLGAVVFVA